jgi:acyl-CoA thioesterase-2
MGDELAGDSLAHACALAFVSDMGSLSGALPRAEGRDPFAGSSVQHAMWFGARPDLGVWHRVDLSPALRHGRIGLAHGSVVDESARPVAVVSQLAFF